MFKKGQVANPNGAGKSAGRRAHSKLQNALDKTIDLLGVDSIDGCGATALAELLLPKLKEDPVGTIQRLACLFPKDIAIDVSHSNSSKLLSDDELADIIAQRARSRHEEKVIEGESIEVKPQLDQGVKVG